MFFDKFIIMPKPDFTKKTKETLQKRAGNICSKPNCNKVTSAPHTDSDKSINIGEAAHIKGARKGAARWDKNMTDEERSHIDNGIWLCRIHAKEIDNDKKRFPDSVLYKWKKEHEMRVSKGKLPDAIRDIKVKNGGVGSKIVNEGSGIGLDIEHDGNQPVERIVVEGEGIGEVITNTGLGTGKRIVSTGGSIASESKVIVNKPVKKAIGMQTKLIISDCVACGEMFSFSQVVQGFAGDKIPKEEIKCPNCGEINLI